MVDAYAKITEKKSKDEGVIAQDRSRDAASRPAIEDRCTTNKQIYDLSDRAFPHVHYVR